MEIVTSEYLLYLAVEYKIDEISVEGDFAAEFAKGIGANMFRGPAILSDEDLKLARVLFPKKFPSKSELEFWRNSGRRKTPFDALISNYTIVEENEQHILLKIRAPKKALLW